jgi:S-adenosylmethionine hydrolase
LTTEWRADDYFFGILRGTIESLSPGAQVIVNASGLPPLNTAHAAFVVRNTFHHYPEGTVHLISVNTESGIRARHLLVKARGHYFIGTDNGIFNLILNSEPEMVIVLDDSEECGDAVLFAKTAAAILGGADTSKLGHPADSIREMVPLRATIDSNAVNGSVIFIDSYGNAITNITRDILSRVFSEKGFSIFIQSNRHRVDHLSKFYSDAPVGELLALFNSLDLLEIAINGANVSELFDLEPGSVVRIAAETDKQGGTGLFT